MRLLHHYPTLSHSFLRNATRLFGFYINYRFIAVHTSQRKKKPLCFTTKKTAMLYNEKRPPRFTTKKDRHVLQRKRPLRFTTKKTAAFHNGAVLSENTN